MLVIGFVIVLLGCVFMAFLMGKHTNKDSRPVSGVSNSKRVESSTRKSNDYTVTDLKNNPKLAAVSFILYGANNMDSVTWGKQKDCFKESQELIVKARGENKADYILARNGQAESDIGYTLTGKNLNQVNFFTLNGSNTKVNIESVNVKKVILFINTKFTDKELNEYMNNITISTSNTDSSSQQSSTIKQKDMANQDVYFKVMIFYGLKNAYGVWNSFNNELENGNNSSFDVLSGTGGNGRATRIHFGNQDGEAQIGLPDSSGKYTFSYDDGEDEANASNDPKVVYATSEEILKYINDNGGYKAINGINVKVRSDNN